MVTSFIVSPLPKKKKQQQQQSQKAVASVRIIINKRATQHKEQLASAGYRTGKGNGAY
jgi:hypothetical protein